MASFVWSTDHPPCSVCTWDKILDRNGRVRRAAVRVGLCRDPHMLRLCEWHLAQLTKVLPPGGVWVVERYQAASHSE